MKTKFISLLGFLAIPLFSIAQDCGCDHVVSDLSDTGVNIIYASDFDYEPGDTFCFEEDTIAGLRLFDFIGTEEEPLTFKNCGGQVTILEDTYSAISFRTSQFVHLTGTGSGDYEYGFHIIESGSGQVGVGVSYLSSDFEVDHFEIENTGFAGIMAKTDPKCADELTWRSNGYVLKNLEIHHNFIHDTEGEGMYIGYTGGYKVQSNVTCDDEYVFGHWLENVDIHHNLLENTGWDGIQVNLARENGRIHDNTILNWGLDGATFQDFAMSIGGGDYEVYNNYMLNETGNLGKGPQFIGMQSGSKIYNNVIINPFSYGNFIHMRYEFDSAEEGYYFVNNTVINPEISGVFYNTFITKSENPELVGTSQDDAQSYFVNNFIANPGVDYGAMGFWKDEPECFFDFITPETRDSQLANVFSNITTRAVDTIGIVDPVENNYRADNETSWLVDEGVDVSDFGIVFDLENMPRPIHGLFDVGAYEYTGFTNLNDEQNGVSVYPNPVSNQLYVSSDGNNIKLLIYNMTGQLLFEKELNSNNSVDLSSIDAGAYLVVLKNQLNQTVYKDRFIKN